MLVLAGGCGFGIGHGGQVVQGRDEARNIILLIFGLTYCARFPALAAALRHGSDHAPACLMALFKAAKTKVIHRKFLFL